MVKFGRYILNNSKEEWKDEYIDYNKLKKLIKELKKKYEQENEYVINKTEALEELNSGESADREMKNLINEQQDIMQKFNPKAAKFIMEFLIELDKEIKKFFLFYQNLEKSIYADLNINIAKLKKKCSNIKGVIIELHFFESLSKRVLEASKYINLNITAIRKILKKFDKKFKLKDNPFAKYYLKKNFKRDKSYLLYVLQFKIIDEASAMIEQFLQIVKQEFDYLCSEGLDCKKDLESIMDEPLLGNIPIDSILSNLSNQEDLVKEINNFFQSINDTLEKIDNDNILMNTNVENWQLIIQNNIRVVESDDGSLQAKRLENQFIDKLVPLKEEETISATTKINIWISLIHTLIYTMNGYIVQTTNGKYIDSLGSDKIMSGIIMSMAHLSSVLSTLVYSHWTNGQTYKFSLIVSCISLMLGNFLYSIAENFNSLLIMGLGRFFVGCGGARIVNRRFLIDQVPKGMIGHYSLFYVNFNCLGMASGPLIGYLIAAVIPEFSFLGVKFDLYTNPGWVCFIMWALYFYVILILYKDPEKSEHCTETTIDDIEKTLTPKRERKSSKFVYRDEVVTNASKNTTTVEAADKTKNASKISSERLPNPNRTESSMKVEDMNQVKEKIEKEVDQLVSNENRIFSNLSTGFLILVSILLIIRMCAESMLIATPLYFNLEFPDTTHIFVVLFLVTAAFAVLPASYLFSKYFHQVPDRKLIHILLWVSFGSCFLLLKMPDLFIYKFIFFYIVLFVCTNLLESETSALLAKIFPTNLNFGLCNSGLTIIMFTSGGRFVGSVLVTFFGVFGLNYMENIMYGFYGVSYFVIVLFFYSKYDDLRVKAINRLIMKKDY